MHILRLGRDYTAHGELQVDVLEGGRGATAISAGSPIGQGASRHVFKQDPNEDALFARVDGETITFGVADAHWGAAASAILIEALAAGPSPLTLAQTFEQSPVDAHGSETTLVHVTYDRAARRGAGLSYGDSTVAVVGDGVPAYRANEKSCWFVTPSQPAGLESEQANPVAFEAPERGLIVAFSDGVDECHYGQPDTSIQLRHLDALYAETGPDPVAFVERLARMAMTGVDGNPGGEDNIAIVAVRT